jgi:HSP20 family protein
MTTIIQSTIPARRSRAAAPAAAHVRSPHFDCRHEPGEMQLVVYVPGVEAAGVDISAQGPDLTIIARKTHFVRPNWTALHLEKAQRDYQLRLRLGHAYDFAALRAEIRDGVLTVSVPEKPAAAAPAPDRMARVA